MQYVQLRATKVDTGLATAIHKLLHQSFVNGEIRTSSDPHFNDNYVALIEKKELHKLVDLIQKSPVVQNVEIDYVDIDEETGEVVARAKAWRLNTPATIQPTFTSSLENEDDISDIFPSADDVIREMNPAIVDVEMPTDLTATIAVETQISNLNTLYALMNKSLSLVNRSDLETAINQFKQEITQRPITELEDYTKAKADYNSLIQMLEQNSQNIKTAYEDEFRQWLEEQIEQLKEQYASQYPDETEHQIEMLIAQHKPDIDEAEHRIEVTRENAKQAILREFALRTQSDSLVDAMTFISAKANTKDAIARISRITNQPAQPVAPTPVQPVQQVQPIQPVQSTQEVDAPQPTQPVGTPQPAKTSKEWEEELKSLLEERLEELSDKEAQDLYNEVAAAEQRGEILDLYDYFGIEIPDEAVKPTVEVTVPAPTQEETPEDFDPLDDDIDISLDDIDLDSILDDTDDVQYYDEVDDIYEDDDANVPFTEHDVEENTTTDGEELEDDIEDSYPAPEDEEDDTFDEFGEEEDGFHNVSNNEEDTFNEFNDPEPESETDSGPYIPSMDDIESNGDVFAGLMEDNSQANEDALNYSEVEFENENDNDVELEDGESEEDEKPKKGRKNKKKKKEKKPKKPKKDKSDKKSKKGNLIVAGGVGLLVLIGLGIGGVYLYAKNQQTTTPTEQTESTTTASSSKSSSSTSGGVSQEELDTLLERAKEAGFEPGRVFNVAGQSGEMRVTLKSINADGSATTTKEDGEELTIYYPVLKRYIDAQLAGTLNESSSSSESSSSTSESETETESSSSDSE